MFLGLLDRVFFQFYMLYVDSNRDTFAAWFFTVMWLTLAMALFALATIDLISCIANLKMEIESIDLLAVASISLLLFNSFYVLYRRSLILSKYKAIDVKNYKKGKVIAFSSFFLILVYYAFTAYFCSFFNAAK